jgi:ATP-dependent Lon protease
LMSEESASAQGLQEIELPRELPVLSSKTVVVFPTFNVPMVLSTQGEFSAVDAAFQTGDRLVLILAAKNAKSESPSPDDLYRVGTLARIARMAPWPDGTRKLVIQALGRLRVVDFPQVSPHLIAKVEKADEVLVQDVETEARAKSVLATFKRVVDLSPILPSELYIIAFQIESPGALADFVGAHLNLETADAQGLLETLDIKERLTKVQSLASREAEVLELGSKIQTEAKEELDKAQRDYILRQQLRAIQKELGETDQQTVEIEELRQKVETVGMSEEAKELATRELERLAAMPPQAAEYSVSRTFLDWLVALPWRQSTEDNLDIIVAQRILDEDHYDLEKVKERIVEYLSVHKLKRETNASKEESSQAGMKGPILCFVGPPGTGKTSLGKSIARALGREFLRISLGGIRDEAEVRGHRRTYVGALPGRIIQGIRRAGSNNPVFMLDEIDKVGMDFRGDPSSALLEVLDPEQNNSFRDHYLEVAFDLSKVMFITTANILDTIPPALRDRMEVLYLPGYTEEEKLKIARRYLLPRQMSENGLTEDHIKMEDGALEAVIRDYTREAGLRNLERQLGAVCRKVARRVAEGRREKMVVREEELEELLGPPLFPRDIVKRVSDVGVAIGLAVTPVGGDILFIEASTMKGSKGLMLTGSLGEVMKESAQAALSYVRAHAQELGIDEDFFQNVDIHLHVPEGAIPKDGPSAGVALTAALVSRLTGVPISHEVAMTGEITLQGRVLPVGGVKDKVLAARRAGLKRVVLPERNKPNISEIPEELRKGMEFDFAETIGDVLGYVLDRRPEHKPRGKRSEVLAQR